MWGERALLFVVIVLLLASVVFYFTHEPEKYTGNFKNVMSVTNTEVQQ